MICGDISSVGGQSSSTDESDSTLGTNVSYIIDLIGETFFFLFSIA
jgi:hypothetical protein